MHYLCITWFCEYLHYIFTVIYSVIFKHFYCSDIVDLASRKAFGLQKLQLWHSS